MGDGHFTVARLATIIPTRLKRALKRAIEWQLHRSTPRFKSHPDVPSVLIAYNECGAYCLPRSSLHRPASQAILHGQVWERETIAFMRTNTDNRDIVHAGTYYGDFLPALSKAVGPRRVVWAFEPATESYLCAKTTIALNNITNVELRQAALGPSPGSVGFVTVDKDGRALGGGSHIDLTHGTEIVAQVRLDDVIPEDRPISILQLDVEGYEDGALRGATGIIRRNRPIIILETVPDGFADVYHYAFERRLHDNSVFRPR